MGIFIIRSRGHTNEQLAANLMQAWNEFDAKTLNGTWGILHVVYRSILRSKGADRGTISPTM